MTTSPAPQAARPLLEVLEEHVDQVRTQRAERIRILRWTLETKIPHDLRTTTHARRVASLKRQRDEARAELANLTLQENR